MDRASHLSALRQIILFALGVAVILDAIITAGTHVAELVTGLVLLGIVPVDGYLSRS